MRRQVGSADRFRVVHKLEKRATRRGRPVQSPEIALKAAGVEFPNDDQPGVRLKRGDDDGQQDATRRQRETE
jgi:hypothetical protein